MLLSTHISKAMWNICAHRKVNADYIVAIMFSRINSKFDEIRLLAKRERAIRLLFEMEREMFQTTP